MTKDKGQLLEISDGRNAFSCSQSTNGLWLWKQKSKDVGRSCGKPLIMALARSDSLGQRQYQKWKYMCSQATGAGSHPSYPAPKVPMVLSSPLLCGTVLPDLPQPCLAPECLCFSPFPQMSGDTSSCLQEGWPPNTSLCPEGDLVSLPLATNAEWLHVQKRDRSGEQRGSRTSPAEGKGLRAVALISTASFPSGAGL